MESDIAPDPQTEHDKNDNSWNMSIHDDFWWTNCAFCSQSRDKCSCYGGDDNDYADFMYGQV